MTPPEIYTGTGDVLVTGTAPVGSMVTVVITPRRGQGICSWVFEEPRQYVANVRPDGTWGQSVRGLSYGAYTVRVTAGGEPKAESTPARGHITWTGCRTTS